MYILCAVVFVTNVHMAVKISTTFLVILMTVWTPVVLMDREFVKTVWVTTRAPVFTDTPGCYVKKTWTTVLMPVVWRDREFVWTVWATTRAPVSTDTPDSSVK